MLRWIDSGFARKCQTKTQSYTTILNVIDANFCVTLFNADKDGVNFDSKVS
jgi:hypothetical protein